MKGIPEYYDGKKLKTTWEYKDLTGQLIGVTARFENPNDPTDKIVIPFFKKNGDAFAMGGVPRPCLLFGLQSLDLSRKKYCFITEGEKCARALHSLGVATVTFQGGVNGVRFADYKPLNGFKRVFILPDNDPPGLKVPEHIVSCLSTLEAAPEVRTVTLAGLPHKGDIVNFIQRIVPEWDGYDPVPYAVHKKILAELRQAYRQSKILTVPVSQEVNQKAIKTFQAMPLQEFWEHPWPVAKCVLGTWFKERGFILISGEAGVGKSNFTMSLALSIASGVPFLDWPVHTRLKVLLVDVEMGESTLVERSQAMLRGVTRFGAEDLEDFAILSRLQIEQQLGECLNLSNSKHVSAILETCSNYDLIVLDCYYRLFEGDENDAETWSAVEKVVSPLQNRGKAVILVHHNPKSNPQAPSGSSRNVRSPDAVLSLCKVADSLAQEVRVRVLIKKLREYTDDCDEFTAVFRTYLDGDGQRYSQWERDSRLPMEPRKEILKEKAIQLKKEGKSVREIEKELEPLGGPSKSTIQTWVQSTIQETVLSRTDPRGPAGQDSQDIQKEARVD